MMTRKDIFSDLDGFDENLPGNFNEVDFCLRLRERGWLIVWTPYPPRVRDAQSRYPCERSRAIVPRSQLHGEKWSAQILRDPYYSPNFVASFARF